jgi:ribosome maturation protein Sdo1
MSAIPENVFLSVLVSVTILVLVFFATLRSIIKIFRTGIDRRLDTLSLVEAKINLFLENAGIEFDPFKGLPQEVADAIRRGEKIRAIQFWRQATGVSLRESKEFIEEVQRRSAVSRRG